MFEKYEPQISKSFMVSEISENYAAASAYYFQRQQMFKKVLKAQAGRVLDSLESEIDDKLQTIWQDNIYKVLEGIYFDQSKTIDQKITTINATFHTSEFLNDYIEAIKKPSFSLFKGKMGNIFEHFIKSEIFDPYVDMASAFANGHLESIVSGAMTSLSSVTKGSKSIRPDLLISSNVEFVKEGGVLTGNNLPLEMQKELIINWDNVFPSFDREMDIGENIFNSFLGNDANFFGFSAKVYNANEDNKHFSSSSAIQKALNSVFWYPYKSNGGYKDRHSWELDYAEVYVIWNLSRIIRTIISPTTVAMIYGDGLMWISNFLQSKVFYMNISYQTKIKERDAGQGRIFPTINSSAIYTKNYNISKGLGTLNTSIVDKKNPYSGKYYKGIELHLS